MNQININDHNKGDEADMSFLTSHLHEQNCIKAHNERSKRENQPNYDEFDGERCVDCDVKIPELRLKLGAIRCVDCQEILEVEQQRHNRLYR